jgi:hypothetical protein
MDSLIHASIKPKFEEIKRIIKPLTEVNSGP